MHTHAKLRFRNFGSDSLSLLREDRQRRYLIEYLADLGATSVVEEPHYFDRESFLQVLVKPQPALAVTVRFARIASYMSRDLTKVLGEGSRALARARMELAERVPPLSLYVGVARVGDPLGALFDVLYDTTDSDHHVRALATVAYHPNVALILERIRGVGLYEYGTVVNAF